MSLWYVRLTGTADALSDLPRFLPSSCSVAEKEGKTYLQSPLFIDSMKAEDLMAVAARLLDAANSVALLHVPRWSAITCDSAVRLREDGTRLHVKLIAAKIAVSATLTASPTVIRADGTVEPPANPPQYNAEATLVLGNDSLRLTLAYLRDPSWPNLYKAYEIVRAEMGGDQKLGDLGWASGTLISRFRHTCQSPTALGAEARHAVEPAAPPSQPLEHAEAKNLVETLISRWIEHQLG